MEISDIAFRLESPPCTFVNCGSILAQQEEATRHGRDKTICSSGGRRSRRLRDQIRTSRRPSDSFPLWMGFLRADRWKKMQPGSSQQECVGDSAGEKVIGRDKRSPFQGEQSASISWGSMGCMRVWFLFWINFGSNVFVDNAQMYSCKSEVYLFQTTTNYTIEKLATGNSQTLMMTCLFWTKVVVTLAPSGVKV